MKPKEPDMIQEYERKKKEGVIKDQPAPVPNNAPSSWDLVIEDMRERDRIGRKRYGTPLQVNNGRDHLIDLYQELLDACVYLRTEIEERKGRRVMTVKREGVEVVTITCDCGQSHPGKVVGTESQLLEWYCPVVNELKRDTNV